MAAGDVDVKVTTNNGQKCSSYAGSSRLGLAAAITAGTIKSYSFWVLYMSRGAGNTRQILRGNRDIIYISSSNNWATSMTGSNVAIAAATNYGVWTNVIVIQNPTTVDYYVGGTYIGQVSTTNTSTFQFLGNTGGLGHIGFLKNVRFYSDILTSTEISRIASGQEVTRTLIYSWDVTENANASVGGVNFTTNNSVSFGNFDNAISNAVRTQRTTTGATGKFLMCGGFKGQVYHAAITEA
jgi:hypothetical protein